MMSKYPGFPLAKNLLLRCKCLKCYSMLFYSYPTFLFLFQFSSSGLELQNVDNEVHSVFAKSCVHISLGENKLFSTQCIAQQTLFYESCLIFWSFNATAKKKKA